MKNIFICLFLIAFASCEEYEERQNHYRVEELGYDPETDSLINKVLDQTPVSITVGYMVTAIRYDQLEIRATHYEQTPYENPEYWFITCSDKEGNPIMIKSLFGIAEHNVSEKTLDRIKSICIEHEKKVKPSAEPLNQ